MLRFKFIEHGYFLIKESRNFFKLWMRTLNDQSNILRDTLTSNIG